MESPTTSDQEETPHQIPTCSKWDRRYMALAKSVSTWSKDPSTQVGAVVVSPSGQVLTQGYNGFPRGIQDTKERLNDRDEKYALMVHAERNAIYNATYNGVSLQRGTMYVYGLPCCCDCAKSIIQVGIDRVVMAGDPDNPRWKASTDMAVSMFQEAGIDFSYTSKE